jgi:hypothetical protein
MIGLPSLQQGIIFMLEQLNTVMAHQIAVFVSWLKLYVLLSAQVYKVECQNNYWRLMEAVMA